MRDSPAQTARRLRFFPKRPKTATAPEARVGTSFGRALQHHSPHLEQIDGASPMGEDKYRLCSCGSGRKFKFCCYEERGIWSGMSGRELMTRVAEFAVGPCYVSEAWQDRGLAQVI